MSAARQEVGYGCEPSGKEVAGDCGMIDLRNRISEREIQRGSEGRSHIWRESEIATAAPWGFSRAGTGLLGARKEAGRRRGTLRNVLRRGRRRAPWLSAPRDGGRLLGGDGGASPGGGPRQLAARSAHPLLSAPQAKKILALGRPK